jgi:hypothetical protein
MPTLFQIKQAPASHWTFFSLKSFHFVEISAGSWPKGKTFKPQMIQGQGLLNPGKEINGAKSSKIPRKRKHLKGSKPPTGSIPWVWQAGPQTWATLLADPPRIPGLSIRIEGRVPSHKAFQPRIPNKPLRP